MKEADLFILLDPVLPEKTYPYVVPQDNPSITAPWMIFSFYEVNGDVFSGQAETMTNIQIDVYAKSPDTAGDILSKALTAIHPLSPANITRKPSYEPDTALYRATLECQVWN